MESYHDRNSLSSRGNPDIMTGESRLARRLGPFEYIATPPIQHLLNAILSYCRVGGSFAPGIRQLGEMSGVTLGLISGLLYELDRTGWISYDGHVIMVLRQIDDDQQGRDQLISDHVITDSLISDGESDYSASESGDQNPDRSNRHMVDSCLTTTLIESAVVKTQIPCAEKNDQPPDHPLDHPILLLLLELGLTPGPGVLERGIAARDWTPQQVRDRYDFDKRRIDGSGGKKHWGIFWTAFIAGELAPARPDPQRPLAPESYADNPAFRLGSQEQPDEGAQRNAVYREAHWRAVDLLGKGAAFGDMRIVVEALVAGASDAQAIQELRSEVPR